MNKVTAIIALVFIIIMILLYVIKLIIKANNKKNISNTIDKLTTEKNMIISANLITELSKAGKLVNNKKIENQVDNWKKRFDDIEKIDMPKLTDELIEAENLSMNKDIEGAYIALERVEKDISYKKQKQHLY